MSGLDVYTDRTMVRDENLVSGAAPNDLERDQPRAMSSLNGQLIANGETATGCRPRTRDVDIESICMDSQLQVREKTDQQRVKRYAALMKDGVAFPPIVVFEDRQTLSLGDGKHRTLATQCNGCESIKAEVRQGTERDAFLYGLLVNAAHGLPLTNAEKRAAVDQMLRDPEWRTLSDREIARRCGVSNGMVSKRRKQMTVNGSQSSKKRKVKRGGKTIEMDTANIGNGGPSTHPSEAITEVDSLEKNDQTVENSTPGDAGGHQELEVDSYSESWSEHEQSLDTDVAVTKAEEIIAKAQCNEFDVVPDLAADQELSEIIDDDLEPQFLADNFHEVVSLTEDDLYDQGLLPVHVEALLAQHEKNARYLQRLVTYNDQPDLNVVLQDAIERHKGHSSRYHHSPRQLDFITIRDLFAHFVCRYDSASDSFERQVVKSRLTLALYELLERCDVPLDETVEIDPERELTELPILCKREADQAYADDSHEMRDDFRHDAYNAIDAAEASDLHQHSGQWYYAESRKPQEQKERTANGKTTTADGTFNCIVEMTVEPPFTVEMSAVQDKLHITQSKIKTLTKALEKEHRTLCLRGGG